MSFSEIVDVIIPVHNQYELTTNCLASVLDTVDRSLVEVIVINDASTDERLSEHLRSAVEFSSISLIEQQTNCGFTRTVNRGMSLHPTRDVILLNTDTVVYGDWVERLRHAAYSDDRIATVNPLTNPNGSHIAFYPATRDVVKLEIGPAEIDAMTRACNRHQRIVAHTTVGYCMYIKRSCLDDIGLFDVEHFPRAYGEEADFCYRAGYVGWKHVVAADVFVTHLHGKSFGPEKAELMTAMLATFERLHPKFKECDAAFWARDPTKLARRALDLNRLSAKISAASGRLLIATSVYRPPPVADSVCLAFDEMSGILSFELGPDLIGYCDLPRFRLPYDIALVADCVSRLGVTQILYASHVCLHLLQTTLAGEDYEIGWSDLGRITVPTTVNQKP
jgi:GT2 family glycosyltransferase